MPLGRRPAADLMFGDTLGYESSTPALDCFEGKRSLVGWIKRLHRNDARRAEFKKAQIPWPPDHEKADANSEIFDVKIVGHFEYTPAVRSPDEQGAVQEALVTLDDWLSSICSQNRVKVWID